MPWYLNFMTTKVKIKLLLYYFLIPMARLNILVEPNLVKDKPDVQSSPFDACTRASMCTTSLLHIKTSIHHLFMKLE